jgi:hypothetical protein
MESLIGLDSGLGTLDRRIVQSSAAPIKWTQNTNKALAGGSCFRVFDSTKTPSWLIFSLETFFQLKLESSR